MENPIASFALWTGLFGGLALFLFGMEIMTQSLKSAAGDYMKDLLGKLTANRFLGVGIGALVTAIIQSSSVTTVLLVGFISAGLMTLSQSIAVILGANIGTTITAQILAFKVTKLALPMITLGFLVSFTSKQNSWKQFGSIVLGLGLVFYGMGLMSDALYPMRSYPPFVDFMVSMDNPLLAAGVGALFTAVVQSSSATTGILIVMASQGLLQLEAAIAIALGANVGTCVTAGLASIGKPREAVRAAVAHTVFNVTGVLLWIGFIPQLAAFAAWISPVADGLTGLDKLAAEAPRQIANVHTFFNVVNALIFVGLTPQLARLVVWLVPQRPYMPEKAMLPKYLDDDLLSSPAIALEAARQEINRLGKRVRKMVRVSMPVALTGRRRDLEEITAMDKVVDARHMAIIEYLGKISLATLSKRQSRELMQLAETANSLEHIGDRIATGLVTSALKRIDEEVHISEQTAEVISEYHQLVYRTLCDGLKSISRQDPELADRVKKRKKDVARLSGLMTAHGLDRLTADEPNRLHTYAREMELVEILDDIFTVSRRLAQSQALLSKKHKD